MPRSAWPKLRADSRRTEDSAANVRIRTSLGDLPASFRSRPDATGCFLPTADIFSILAVSRAFDFDYAKLCMQSLASKMQGIVSRLRFWRSGLAKDSDFHLRELHAFDSREGFSQNLIEHKRSGIGPAETCIAHKHEPHPRMATR